MIDDNSSFDATWQTEATIAFSADSLLLSADGAICEVIHEVAPRPDDNDTIIASTWLDLVQLSQNHNQHPTGILVIQTYFRTLIADNSGYGIGRMDFRNNTEAQRFQELVAGFFL